MNISKQDSGLNELSYIIKPSHIQSLLTGFSLEITTKEALGIPDFEKVLPVGTEVYIVSTPNTKPNDVIDLAKRLHNDGMVPVPHIAARGIPRIEMIDKWLNILNREAKVDRALIIAGDSYGKANGSFASSLELVLSNALANNGIVDLRFAGHPEGHPLLNDTQLIDILSEKQRISRKFDYKTSLVTQFFFDFSVVAKWERRLLQHGLNLPIRVGFHGVVGITSLIKQASYCGIGASLQQLMKNPSKLLQTTTLATPEQLILGLAKHCQDYPHNLFSGCHFFPFGNFEKTAKWVMAIIRGKFEL